MRRCKAILTVNTGRAGTRQFPVQRVLNYTTMQSIDNDADQFSVDIGNKHGDLNLCLNRDNEVEVQLFLSDFAGRWVPIFRGIADSCEMEDDHVLSIQGRDTVTSLAMDSDAIFGKWPSVAPRKFIEGRARRLGITRMSVAHMTQMNKLVSDGSETEWAMWYRMVRKKGMYIWTDNLGGMVIDKLGYDLNAIYRFGHGKGYLKVISPANRSNKQNRRRNAWVYGEDAKKGRPIVAKAQDTHIGAWRKKGLVIATDTTAKNQSELQEGADEEIFETIVGAREVELTIRDVGTLIKQNTMARLNLPEYGLTGLWFIVGVQRQGGASGMLQVVRLREKEFALTERVPDAPTLTPDPSRNKPATNIGQILANNPNIRWGEHFVAATNEFGVKNGWDFSVFLGALLSMCMQETAFKNVREGNSDQEWANFEDWASAQGENTESPQRYEAVRVQYEKEFANEKDNPRNPYSREAGVGPMQLTQPHLYKEWADSYGWYGIPKKGELNGGRWNPASNIRAAARVLVEKLKQAPPARPTNADDIWIGVMRYNGSQDYADKVRKIYNNIYKEAIKSAVQTTKTVRPGSTDTHIAVPGYGTLDFPDNTPDPVRKAISWALSRIGDAYLWGGSGPLYDCSSFVTKAISMGGATAKEKVDEPHSGSHGDTTYTLFRKGRFPAPTKDNLLPGDLVFFDMSTPTTPEHVGMYLTDGLFIHDPHTGDHVKVSPLNDDYRRASYGGARRVFSWPTGPRTGGDDRQPGLSPGGPGGATGGGGGGTGKRVMIQAGHDPGGHSDQPYGHTGQSGAPGEVDFTISVRDHTLALLDGDPHFTPVKGTAWSASAGATAASGDDQDFQGDLFISIHYDAATAGGSRYFFGWPTGRGSAVSQASQRLKDEIVSEYNKIPGHPNRNTSMDNSNEALYGYYAYGHPSRSFPDNVDHTDGVSARLIFETGEGGTGGDDRQWLLGHQARIGLAIYRAICNYYGFKPTGGT